MSHLFRSTSRMTNAEMSNVCYKCKEPRALSRVLYRDVVEADEPEAAVCGPCVVAIRSRRSLRTHTVGGIEFFRFGTHGPLYCFPMSIAYTTRQTTQQITTYVQSHHANDIIEAFEGDFSSDSLGRQRFQDIYELAARVRRHLPRSDGTADFSYTRPHLVLFPLSLALHLLQQYRKHLFGSVEQQVQAFIESVGSDSAILRLSGPARAPLGGCLGCGRVECTKFLGEYPNTSKLALFCGWTTNDRLCPECVHAVLKHQPSQVVQPKRKSVPTDDDPPQAKRAKTVVPAFGVGAKDAAALATATADGSGASAIAAFAAAATDVSNTSALAASATPTAASSSNVAAVFETSPCATVVASTVATVAEVDLSMYSVDEATLARDRQRVKAEVDDLLRTAAVARQADAKRDEAQRAAHKAAHRSHVDAKQLSQVNHALRTSRQQAEYAATQVTKAASHLVTTAMTKSDEPILTRSQRRASASPSPSDSDSDASSSSSSSAVATRPSPTSFRSLRAPYQQLMQSLTELKSEPFPVASTSDGLYVLSSQLQAIVPKMLDRTTWQEADIEFVDVPESLATEDMKPMWRKYIHDALTQPNNNNLTEVFVIGSNDPRQTLRGAHGLRMPRGTHAKPFQVLGFYGGWLGFESEAAQFGVMRRATFGVYAMEFQTRLRRHRVVCSAFPGVGNNTRFINACTTDDNGDAKKENCRMGEIRFNGVPFIFLYTTKTVRALDELLLHYGPHYWSTLAEHQRQQNELVTALRDALGDEWMKQT